MASTPGAQLNSRSVFGRLRAVAIAAVVGVFGILALIVATVAVAGFGVAIAAVALIGRMRRRTPRAYGAPLLTGELLEARRTARGWVAEPPAA